MDLSKGSKRLTNRKTVKQANPVRRQVRPEVKASALPTPVFGELPDLRKEFESTLDIDRGIVVTPQEREIISSKTLKQRKLLPQLEITDISYNLISHEELEQEAVFEAKNTEDSGIGSVSDVRGGTVDSHVLCATCHQDNLECSGHLGIIKLNRKIIHPLFRKEVVYILQSVCGSCGGLLLPESTLREKGILELQGRQRLKAIAKESIKVPCRRSNKEEGITPCINNPIYKTNKLKETGNIFYTRDEKSKTAENIRTVEEIENILDNISDEDAAILGFSNGAHPRRFIMRSLPVIPLCARAPVYQDGVIMNDDLTNMYKDIIKDNNELARKDLTETEENARLRNLIYHIEHLLDNTDAKYKQGKKVYQSIKERIQGKEALIRSAMMGKRVNFSARTVLGPDPTLRFGQIRVPRVMAPYLTQHETVTPENMRKMNSLLRAGKITYITRVSGKLEGKRIKVTPKIRDEHTLTLGDEVDRWLENGDWLVYNRQPTLHKQGMMGYEVVLGDPLTIGLHLGYTRQHNADFDGDESLLAAAQSEDVRREIAGLMSVTCNIMNAQTNNNIAGVVFDALTGAYLLSNPETIVDDLVFAQLRTSMEDEDTFATLNERLDKYGVPRNSGKALLSMTFPPDFWYEKGNTKIREGILISGRLDSSNIGSAHGSIIQAIYKDYGMKRTSNFLTDIYRAGGYYLDTHGFSISIQDCQLSGDNPRKVIEYEVQRARMLVRSMGVKLADPLEEERREKQIKAYLDTAKNFGAKISKENLDENNAFNVMAKSGAKGSVVNIASVTGILGQQFLYGQRLPQTMSGGTRTLPYFRENDVDPSARGFIVNSYMTGLTPSEMFMAFVSARSGVVDSSTRISDTGALERNIVKNLEDIKVYPDGSVRNATGVILQFSYANDSREPSLLQLIETPTGKFKSFIDLKRVAGRINSKYGFNK